MKKRSTKAMVMLAFLTAIEIILSRFYSISAWNLKIGFSFVPIVIAAVFFGPAGGGIVGALGDFIGAILFPIGAYFPGFTVTAFLTGVVFGLFLHKRQGIFRILGAVAVNQLVLSLSLNTLWISILYGSPYGPLFITRIAQAAVLAPVEFLVICGLSKCLSRYRGVVVI